MKDLVSIIIPVYNVESFIGKCAESLFTQTYPNCEFVFVNDCSSDSSLSVLDNYIEMFDVSNKTIIINHKVNMGLAQARNTGVKNSHGKYIMHVDSDDYIDSTTIYDAYNVAIANDADIVLLGLKHIFPTKTVIEQISIPENKDEYINNLIQRKCACPIWGTLYKKELYTQNNIEAVPGLNMGEDYSTKPKLIFHAKKIIVLNKPLYNYSHSNLSSYTSKFTEKNVHDIVKAVVVLENFFDKNRQLYKYYNSFRIAKAMAKIYSINSWALSSADYTLLDCVSNNFSNTSYNDIPKQYWIVNFLYDRKCYCALRKYIRLGFRIKFLLK